MTGISKRVSLGVEGAKKSETLEDRRRMGPATVAIGGLGMLLLLVIGALMGVDPQRLRQRIGNAPGAARGGGGQAVEREFTSEEVRSRDFVATILA